MVSFSTFVLRDKHSVEGIVMVEREIPNFQGVFGRYGKW